MIFCCLVNLMDIMQQVEKNKADNRKLLKITKKYNGNDIYMNMKVC